MDPVVALRHNLVQDPVVALRDDPARPGGAGMRASGLRFNEDRACVRAGRHASGHIWPTRVSSVWFILLLYEIVTNKNNNKQHEANTITKKQKRHEVLRNVT